ncbi:MAG: glucan biosynthesis protein D [Propionivibrio sp.]
MSAKNAQIGSIAADRQRNGSARRDFLRALAALGLISGVGARYTRGALAAASAGASSDPLPLGAPQAFDYAWLKGHARALAERPYQAPDDHGNEALKKLTYDGYQAIRFRPDHALWADADSRYRVQFFHLGLFYQAPVHLFELHDGQAQGLAYDPAMFDYGKSGLEDAHLMAGLGFAGFRVNFHTDWQRDALAFLGASYFRAVGAEMQYGLSARGLAIDSGMDRPEEFPRFTAFWFERPAPDSDELTIYALLDSPSVAGAYRFNIVPGASLLMEVDAALYPRQAIERLGVAPLTSMYQYGENDRRMATDWRPEIHDSDGLSLWTGRGEWIWRPLVNPAHLRFNAYADENPRGFGLLQRDRQFDHYQDDGVFYERRPSLWVEPQGDWGHGSVQLIELPTVDETNDNIVAFWNPEQKPQAGEELLFSYRLWWGTQMPNASPLARVVATRTGIGGNVGQKRPYFSWRFVVDFVGGPLPMIGKKVRVEPVITASRGGIESAWARPIEWKELADGYRANFDLRPTDDSVEPVNLRLFLSVDGQALSETWMYQWTPPNAEERKRFL